MYIQNVQTKDARHTSIVESACKWRAELSMLSKKHFRATLACVLFLSFENNRQYRCPHQQGVFIGKVTNQIGHSVTPISVLCFSGLR